MSSGPFINTFYETNNGTICSIRVQPETLELEIANTANSPPSGPATNLGSAVVSRGRRSFGVNARLAYFRFNTAPAGYKQDEIIALPVLTPTLADLVTSSNTPAQYLGQAGVVTGISPERIR